MAAETLEDHNPQRRAPNGDAAPKAEADAHENQAAKPKAAAEEEVQQPQQDKGISDEVTSAEVDNSEEKNADDSGQEEEKNQEDADHEEGEEEEDSEERKSGKGNGKAEKKESDPSTPATASERPTRERKSVDRYTVSSPHKFPRSSATKTFSIDKGTGTQLKDIPNVAFKLSKRKADDNLRALHSIMFGKKAKARDLKRNIGLFSGYVWAENEEKQRAKVKERIDKCVKEKLVDFCDVLNVQINKSGLKKEELSAKLLEFLESPYATTNILLADKEKTGKKRARKKTSRKSSGKASETPSKNQKQTSQVGKKRKQSSDIEEDDTAEPSDATIGSQDEDEDVSVPKSESESDREDEEIQSEEGEDKRKAHKGTSKKTVKEDQSTPVKKTSTVKAAKSNEKTPKNSTSTKTVTDSTSASLSKSKQSASKRQKTVSEKRDSKGKLANKKQTDKSSKALVKDQGKGNSSKKAKAEPSREDMHAVVFDMLKEVDFNTATLSDILRQLGTHFGLDLMHRKAEVKDIITDVINNMSDEEDEGEEAENGDDADDDADKDDA